MIFEKGLIHESNFASQGSKHNIGAYGGLILLNEVSLSNILKRSLNFFMIVNEIKLKFLVESICRIKLLLGFFLQILYLQFFLTSCCMYKPIFSYSDHGLIT